MASPIAVSPSENEIFSDALPVGASPIRADRRSTQTLAERGATILRWAGRWIVPVIFGVESEHKLLESLTTGWIGTDFRIYREAAVAAVHGRDPWLATSDGLHFAGPPPTLVAYLPTALLPEIVGGVIYFVIGVVAAVMLVRALRLPVWWVLFPPLIETVLLVNPDVVVLFLLVCGGRLAGLAVALKVYAAVPLLAQKRFGAVGFGLLVSGLSLPLWATFVADAPFIAQTLRAQAVGVSAWETYLLVPAALAVLSMRHAKGEWLAVPALWPYTQPHYALIALPALAPRRALTVAMSFSYPLLTPAAIIGQAVWEWWRGRLVPPIQPVTSARGGRSRIGLP